MGYTKAEISGQMKRLWLPILAAPPVAVGRHGDGRFYASALGCAVRAARKGSGSGAWCIVTMIARAGLDPAHW
jgi:hypothetical protein